MLLTCYGCSNAQQKSPALFNFEEYKTISKPTTKQDSAIVFITLILDKKYEQAEKLYPAMFKIDVAPFMSEGTEYNPYLAEVGEFVNDYMNTYDGVSLAVFLENKYNAHDNVYDMLLRGSLRADSTNVPAMFLLAKLRYKNDITDDAYYLVQHMMKLEPDNKKVRELNAYFKDNHEPLGDNLPNFDTFIRQEVYYRELE
ncbi:hypothetical protein I2I11_08870 [Pontibacter sp. 172403-2]|uniref:hypothetical protein n=1 Tax=Pontibacter rufus TaxID=2791028 RepID=UPI0018AF5940|nr:hypothetical protein [Pontibacter sp. 172403-2]MBF9253402.1 hypothetical protein [Pontibacter sp. 172403-2]